MGLFGKKRKGYSENRLLGDPLLPIPTHLKDIFYATGNKNCESYVCGKIICSCKCGCFKVRIYAEEVNGSPYIREYKDGYAMVVKASCEGCEKEHLILDISKHGWDGFICREGVTVPDEELSLRSCPKCGCENHSIEICIHSDGKADFIDEIADCSLSDDFDEDDWVDAFGCMGIGLKCLGCGRNYSYLIDYEAS